MNGQYFYEGTLRYGAVVGIAAVLTPSACAQTARAGVVAHVVSQAEVSADAAGDALIATSPGLFAIRIPGSSGVNAVELTPATIDSGGSVVFLGSREAIDAIRQLVAQGLTSSQMAQAGHLTPARTVNGDIQAGGVQVIWTQAGDDNDQGGILAAVITFD